VYLKDTPILNSMYVWSEKFERVRTEYLIILHKKNIYIYSPQRRANDINMRENM
jgi:hypothetical protein